jgi:multimeric flavodoxin WrbA
VLRDMKISPCLEIYGCKKDGQCVIKDDFQKVLDAMLGSQGIMLASPVFFYAVSAHTKILMDRCQSLWVRKHWIEKCPTEARQAKRRGLLICTGATKGKRLFDGPLLTARYFFAVLDTDIWRSLLYRGLDLEDDAKDHPEYLEEAYESGRALCQSIAT